MDWYVLHFEQTRRLCFAQKECNSPLNPSGGHTSFRRNEQFHFFVALGKHNHGRLSGASFLIELSSATATKTGAPREARYQLQLNPGINIPYLAEPKAQLEALTFANVFTNVDQDFYKNAKLKVTWNPYVNTESGASVTAPVRHQKELEVTLPPGHYNVLGGSTLQHKIGELLYADQTITNNRYGPHHSGGRAHRRRGRCSTNPVHISTHPPHPR